MKVFEALNTARNLLNPILKDKRFAYTAAETLLMHVLKITKEKLLIIFRDKLPDIKYKKFMSLVKRRAAGEPLQYILGYWWFYGRKFFTRKGVLIPRQDTEAVIEAVKSLEHDLPEGAKAVDVGSGTGIIGVTIKLECPGIIRMLCVDINPKAIALTRRNSRQNKALISCAKGDFFRLAALKKPQFGLVVSNPPYVKKTALKGLQKEVQSEPKSALLAHKNGMEYYVKFAQTGRNYLLPGGFLVLEVGDGMAGVVRRVFRRPEWRFIRGVRDFRGKMRAVVFKRVKSDRD